MGKLVKLRDVEADLGVARSTIYAYRDAGLTLHNVGAGRKRPTYAVDPDELRRFMARPLARDLAKPARRRRQQPARSAHYFRPRPVPPSS